MQSTNQPAINWQNGHNEKTYHEWHTSMTPPKKVHCKSFSTADAIFHDRHCYPSVCHIRKLGRAFLKVLVTGCNLDTIVQLMGTGQMIELRVG